MDATDPRPLPSFTDRSGRVWEVRLTVRAIRELAAVGTDFEKILGSGESLAWFLCDATLEERVSLLWTAVRTAAQGDGVTREAFEAAIDRMALAGGVVAVAVAASEFYPHTAFGRVVFDNPGGLHGWMEQIITAQVGVLKPRVDEFIAWGLNAAKSATRAAE